MSVLDKLVSYYPSTKATMQGKEVNLLTILRSDKHKDLIQNLRCSDEQARKVIKDALPCFTPTGTFIGRCEEGLKEYSGLAPVDLDSTEKMDKQYLLTKLRKLPYLAYLGLSCSGNRLWGLVPFLYPDKYAEHYERLIKSFADMGLPISDECHKQISQPRFVSWNDDSTQFFNHEASKFNLLPEKRTYHLFSCAAKKITPVSFSENAFEWCVQQINKSYDFVKDKRHPYIVHLARYCNMKGLPEQETLNGCLRYIEPEFDEEEITDIVKHIYVKQANSHNSHPYSEKKTSDDTASIVEVHEKPERKILEGSWLGTDEKFYIPNPVQPNSIAVYESPEAYNNRLHIPTYIERETAEKIFLKWMPVDLQTLKTVQDKTTC